MRRFPYNTRLVLLALFMLVLWFVCGFWGTRHEDEVWRTVRGGQSALWQEQMELGITLSRADDKLKTGFIGVEWSNLTTTLGSLEAKRTSADPLWAAQFLHWFEKQGLQAGDPVVIYSSSSFPAMLFSAVVAAESAGLRVLLAVSLGSSTWGANREDFPLPAMWKTLTEGGYVKTRPAFYTPGGAAEAGSNLEPEIMQMFSRISEEEGIPLIITRTLDEMVDYKVEKMIEFAPKLFISIGGSNANLGDSAEAAEIPNGLLQPNDNDSYPIGDGTISHALISGIPTLNILNIRQLAADSGIPWDPVIFVKRRRAPSPLMSLLALAVFLAVLCTHKRWAWEGENHG